MVRICETDALQTNLIAALPLTVPGVDLINKTSGISGNLCKVLNQMKDLIKVIFYSVLFYPFD